MELFRRYRFLMLICSLGALAAFAEPPGDKQVGEISALRQSSNATLKMEEASAELQAAFALAERYPNDEETMRIIAMDAKNRGDYAKAKEFFEKAIATGVKTSEDIFYHYAVTLIAMKAPEEEVRQAIKNWNFHSPFSQLLDPYTQIGLDYFNRQSYQTALEYFKKAAEWDITKGEVNQYYFAKTLIQLESSQAEIDKAVEIWKTNFPKSKQPDPREVDSNTN